MTESLDLCSWPDSDTLAVQFYLNSLAVELFRQVADMLGRVPRLTVYRRKPDEVFYLTWSDLARASSHDDQWSEARRVADIVKGVVRFEFDCVLEGGSLCCLHPDGRVTADLRGSIVGESDVRARVTASGQPQPDPALLLNRALGEPKLEWLLRLYLASDESWVSLYKLLEAVLELDGPTAVSKRVDKNKIAEFKRTANTARAIGLDARHGDTKNPPSKKPMTHAEAKRLILGLVRGSLEGKMVPAPGVGRPTNRRS